MLKVMNETQAGELYDLYMKEDFPDDELKPRWMITDAVRNGTGVFLGYYREETLLGYGFFLIAEPYLMMDYFAILKEYRREGLGTKFLKELQEYFDNYDAILLEAEYNPTDEAQKRLCFYQNAGCLLSTMYCYLYYVDYVILALPLREDFTVEMIDPAARYVYRIIYPDLLGTHLLQLPDPPSEH